MDQQLLFAAIDRAIRNVADAEFRRLAAEMGPEAWHQNVHNALESLGKLQQGTPPDYNDDWVALFYLTWYQASQINLAHSLIEEMNRSRKCNNFIANDTPSLHVVDFGCGALAMQFAIAWAAAEALENGANIESIRVGSCDVAIPMIRLGQQLWREFKQEISRYESLRTLSDVCEEVIRPRYGKPESGILFNAHRVDEERWLSAIHTVYENNVEELRESLYQLAQDITPANGILSCHNDSNSKQLLRKAAPFLYGFSCYGKSIRSQIDDWLPEVTQWRLSLLERLEAYRLNPHPFLKYDAMWRFRRSFARFYFAHLDDDVDDLPF